MDVKWCLTDILFCLITNEILTEYLFIYLLAPLFKYFFCELWDSALHIVSGGNYNEDSQG